MIALTYRQKLAVTVALVALLIATRGHHFATIKQVLPSASWAVFFLAGAYLRPAWLLAGFLGVAAIVDWSAVTWDGVSNFCVSPAYVALIPAYGALWLAGRWYASRYTFEWRTLLPLTVALFGGIAVCEVISSGSFYFYSGRFAEPTLAEFGVRLITYGPHYLRTTTFWVAVAAVVHVVVVATPRSAAKPSKA